MIKSIVMALPGLGNPAQRRVIKFSETQAIRLGESAGRGLYRSAGRLLGSVLDRESIRDLIEAREPLVAGYLDMESQLQPNGFDLTLREVRRFTTAGELGRDPAVPGLAHTDGLSFDADGRLYLSSGAYLITLNEVLNLPLHVMALARPRSSLLRCGVAVHTAVWDAGYRGRSQALMTIYNPLGYHLAKDARVLQMVFMYLAKPTEQGYRGRYLGENV